MGEMELRDEYKARDKPKKPKGKPKSQLTGAATEMKSLCKPPMPVKETMSAVMGLLGHTRVQAERWDTAKKALGDTKFAQRLESLQPSSVPKENVDYAKEKLSPFTVEMIKNCSAAAADLFL